MGRRAIAVAVLLVAVASPTYPAGAFHDPGIPVLSEDGFSSGGVGYRLIVQGPAERVDLEVELTFEGTTNEGEGVWLLDSNGDVVASFVGFGWSGGLEPDVYVQVPPPAGVVVDLNPASGFDGGSGMAMGLEGLDPGEYTGVVGGAADGTLTGTARLYGSGGIKVLGKTTGTESFILRERDFDGVANAHAYTIAGGASAMVAENATASVGAPLFGWFYTSGPLASWEGPGGATGSGETSYIFSGSAAGDYSFNTDLSLGADLIFTPITFVFGIAVSLPVG